MPETAPTAGAGFTVGDLCRRWRIGEAKVHGFLRCGELIGTNLATSLSGRPQWRVSAEAVRQFEAKRTSAPPPKPQRRRRPAAKTDYYPD